MPVRVTCPHCQGTMEAGDELLGKQARCPFCQQVLRVEPPSPPKSAPRPPAEPRPPARERPAGKTAPPAPPAPPPGPALPPGPGPALADENGHENGHAAPAAPPRQEPLVPPYYVTRLPPEAPPPHAADRDGHHTNGQPAAPSGPADGPIGLVLGAHGHRKKRNPFVALARSLMQRGNPTDASVLLTAALAGALTALLYLWVESVTSVRRGYFGVLLTERTWVVHCTVYFALWAACIMAVKWWKLAGQQTALTYDLLPTDPATKIHSGNIDLVQAHIRQLPVHPQKSFLVKRVLLGLEHFKARQNVAEVGAVLTSQADTDGAMVESSYSMLKVLIWGIPILGFIGTVVGISEAVSGFTQSVQAAENLDVVKAALGNVTKGLAVAFDTTLIGLVLSLVVMFPTHSLQKAEDDLLSSVDQYCNEKLLPRLATEAETRPFAPAAAEGALRALVDDQQAALQEWQKRLENLETALFERVVDTLAEMRQEHAPKAKTPGDAAAPAQPAAKG